MTTLHEVTTNDNREELARAMADATEALRRAVDAQVGVGPDASFAKREVALLEVGNEAQRAVLEEDLERIAQRFNQGEELLIAGKLYRPHEQGAVPYHSLCGTLGPILRYTYRLVGEHNGPTVVPLELEAGLVERATPALAYRVALGHAKANSRSTEEDLLASHRVPPSRATIETMAKRIGTEAKQAAPRIERYLRLGEALPEGATGVAVGLDRTAVPMEEERPADQPPKTRRKKRVKPYERTPPPPVDVNYHMAYLGTVSITDKYGDMLVARRYAASPDEGPEDIIRRMMADVRNALRRDAGLAVGVLQDGAPEMWNLVRSGLTELTRVESWLEGIDRYHLDKRFGKVLRVIEPDEAERKRTLHRWNEELDADDGTIDRIESHIAWELRCGNYDAEDSEVLRDNARFISNNKDRMRYVGLREAGLPVGSGVTEGGCRSVIGERVKRASRRWHQEGLDAALALRSIYASDRLPRFFTHLNKRYTAEIQTATIRKAA